MRNKIARAVFASAESMGISDRNIIEGLADQVIARLDRVPTLPGMEDLAPQIKRPVQKTEIESIVTGILAERGPESFVPLEEQEERQATRTAVKTKAKVKKDEKTEVKVSPNARTVLERRYLVKDKKGQG